MASTDVSHHVIEAGESRVSSFEQGEGPAILFLPSLARGVEDYKHVADLVANAGFRVLRVENRGIGSSTGPMKDVTLHHLAADIAALIEQRVGEPAVVVGHAFGSFVARMLAADRPDLVRATVVLAGSSGLVVIDPEANESVMRASDESLSEEERLVHLRRAFFAPTSDPRIWLTGWHPHVKVMQRAAIAAVPADEWTGAGTAPVLNLQCANDTIAPPHHAHTMAAKYGDRITTKMIMNAGHAAVEEQPEAIAEAIVAYVRKL